MTLFTLVRKQAGCLCWGQGDMGLCLEPLGPGRCSVFSPHSTWRMQQLPSGEVGGGVGGKGSEPGRGWPAHGPTLSLPRWPEELLRLEGVEKQEGQGLVREHLLPVQGREERSSNLQVPLAGQETDEQEKMIKLHAHICTGTPRA